MKTHDQLAYEDAYEQRQRDDYIERALKDCTEALIQTDEDTIVATLSVIGNLAFQIQRCGDTDDKLAFVDEVCTTMLRLIHKYAEIEACLDLAQMQENQ